MPLQRGEVQGYDFNRSVVEFTMLNQGKLILCAISTTAMDDIEGKRNVRPDQRVDQFMRLREVIEERASRKFFEEKAQTDRPDQWCCGPTISIDSCYFPSSIIIEGTARRRRSSPMSALSLKADMCSATRDVRFVPIASVSR